MSRVALENIDLLYVIKNAIPDGFKCITNQLLNNIRNDGLISLMAIDVENIGIHDFVFRKEDHCRYRIVCWKDDQMQWGVLVIDNDHPSAIPVNYVSQDPFEKYVGQFYVTCST